MIERLGYRAPAVLLLTVVLGQRSAAAAEPLPPFLAPSAALNLHCGINMPVGWLGAELELDPVRWLALGIGGGYAEDGLQGMAQLRGRIPIGGRGWAITIGAGGSRGHYSSRTSCDTTLFEPPKCYVEREGDVWWGTGEVGVEKDADSGIGLPLRVRGFFGVKVPLNPDDVHCTAAPAGPCKGGAGLGLYLGVSGGFAFPLSSR